jgi:O-antigen ligase
MSLYYLFLLLAPFQEHPKLGAVLLRVGFMPITPIKIIGMAMVACALWAPPPLHAAKRLRNSISTLYCTFAGLPLLLSFIFGMGFPKASGSALISYTFLLISTRRLVSTRERLRNVIRVLVFSEAFGTLWLYKQQYVLHLANPNGPSGDPNYEALSIVMTIPLAMHLLRNDPSPIWRRIALGCLPVMTFAVFVSQSRGGVVALGLLVLLGWARSQHKVSAIILGTLALGIAIAASPRATIERFEQIQISGRARTGAEVSTRTRIELWKGGLRMIEANPLVGIGLDQFKSNIANYNPKVLKVGGRAFIAHNTYIQVTAEEGVPMLLVFLAGIWSAMKNCRYAERHGNTSGHGINELGIAMRLSLIAYMVAAFFLSAQLVKMLWMLVFLSQNVREIVTVREATADQSAIHNEYIARAAYYA